MFVAQSSEGIFRQDLDAPIPTDLSEDELVQHILYDSYFAECNDAIANMYGFNSARDLIGKRLVGTLDPTDPHNIELTREYIRSGFRVLERESHEVDIHGNPKVFLNSMIGIVEDGKLVRTWGIQRDITERKRAEETLRESQAELAHMARIATMGELTTSIAHEINQPLTAVVTNGSACLRWLAMHPPDLDEARDALTATIGEANRASEVIKRIRALLMKTPPDMRSLDVNEIIREVLTLVSGELDRRSVCVQTNLARDLSAVPGDRVQLQQVVLNLVLNAIEAMSTITDRRREMLVKSTNDSDGVLVQVQDSGTGLVPKQEESIFEPFFTTKPQGIGMGLAIARSIVEAHGGRLRATRGSPYGAVFQFTLSKEGAS
jgi:PAS domain S-box-containing protein